MTILDWSRRRESRYVCFCNVHSVVTAKANSDLGGAIERSSLALPDGMPVALLVGLKSGRKQSRISGPDATVELCEQAEKGGISVAFVGGSEDTLERLSNELARRFPGLRVAGTISPPFRPLSLDEERELVDSINALDAGLIFVGLGCPKQEIWMASHAEDVKGVMLGVGAAFDFLAGTVERPPEWMQRAGLEWLGRLLAEPKRLWRRYLVTNSLFIWYLLVDMLRIKPR